MQADASIRPPRGIASPEAWPGGRGALRGGRDGEKTDQTGRERSAFALEARLLGYHSAIGRVVHVRKSGTARCWWSEPAGRSFAALQSPSGHQVRIVDQGEAHRTHSYALVAHPETLARCSARGVPQRPEGRRRPARMASTTRRSARPRSASRVDGARAVALVSRRACSKKSSRTRLARWDVHVEWNPSADRISQDAEGVTASCKLTAPPRATRTPA